MDACYLLGRKHIQVHWWFCWSCYDNNQDGYNLTLEMAHVYAYYDEDGDAYGNAFMISSLEQTSFSRNRVLFLFDDDSYSTVHY